MIGGFPVRALVSTSPVTKPPHRGLLEALSADFGPTRTLGEPFVFGSARCARLRRYFWLRRSRTASAPPSTEMAAATVSIDFAVTLPIVSIASALPSASLIRRCISPSDWLINCIFTPSDLSIWLCLCPSDREMSARRSRSADICFSIDSLTDDGGTMFLTSKRFTCTPHWSSTSCMTFTTRLLISSRSENVCSKVNLPISERIVVWARLMEARR